MTVGTATSSVVDKTWKKRQTFKRSQYSLFWCGINFVMTCLLYYEMKFNTISSMIEITHPLLWYTECGLATLFFLSMVTNLVLYLKPYLSSTAVEITSDQRKLLAVKDSDIGFRTSPTKAASPNSFTEDTSMIFSASPSPSSSFGSSTTRTGRLTPTNITSSKSHLSMNSPAQSLSFTSYGSPSFDRSMGNVSLTASGSYLAGQGQPYSPTGSPFSMNSSINFSLGNSLNSSMDGSGLRSRFNSSVCGSPGSTSFDHDQIVDQNSLSQYLKEQEEKEYKAALSAVDTSLSSGQSFWTYGRSAADCSHVLKKYMYQLASRSPQSLATRNSENDMSSPFSGEDVWSKRGVAEDDLYLWTERLRKWISLTIVTRLAKQIDDTNADLRRIGCEDTEIGEVSVSTLKQLALTKGSYLPTLNVMIPFLDFSSKQDYLVKRIKDLGKDGCMSEFKWQSGGHYGKPWGEHLPNDAGIIMHLLCSYLDSRLPSQPKYPDGRTFTAQYFIKTPDKPNLDKSDVICIYQSSINPPHFNVVIEKKMHVLPKGRNNMFQAILLFLHHIKTKEHGMLGRINLGMSGVNILWVVDK